MIRVHVPSLTERHTDIPLLARHFLDQSAKELGGEPKTLHPDTVEFLSRLPWPGNVRQLENTCRWLTVMASGREILIEDLPPELRKNPESLAATSADEGWGDGLQAWARRHLTQKPEVPLLDVATPQFERAMIYLWYH